MCIKLLIALCCFVVHRPAAQPAAEAVRWLSFEQLDSALAAEPRPVFIDFYADWCTACRKMDRETYTDPSVATLLNDTFYAVRMNVESPDTVRFGGQTFINERRNRVNPVHQIPLLMASRQNRPFSLPAMVLLDRNFVATDRYFQYLSPHQLLTILEQH